MICIIALIVFGILGIFSVGYRKLALEAFDCVFKRMTLRPCETGFDQKMRTKVVSKLMKYPKVAKTINKHFEVFSWIFTITLFLSMAYSGYAIYNLAVHGTCTPEHPENCIFTPMLNNQSPTNVFVCEITGDFVEFYGAGCSHCAAMVPIVEQVEAETGITFQKIEIWENETNQQTFFMHAEDIERDCGLLGVPAFYAHKTGKAICGEVSAKDLKDFIRKNG